MFCFVAAITRSSAICYCPTQLQTYCGCWWGVLTGSDPIRYLLTVLYMRSILHKRFSEVAVENLQCENEEAKNAVKAVKTANLEIEEWKHPKMKATRIITIKGKHNSSKYL